MHETVTILSAHYNTVQFHQIDQTSNMLQYEEEINFLHGTLKIHVIEARDLPDTDSTFFNISRGDWTDPYVVIFLDKTEICKTAYLQVRVKSEKSSWRFLPWEGFFSSK